MQESQTSLTSTIDSERFRRLVSLSKRLFNSLMNQFSKSKYLKNHKLNFHPFSSICSFVELVWSETLKKWLLTHFCLLDYLWGAYSEIFLKVKRENEARYKTFTVIELFVRSLLEEHFLEFKELEKCYSRIIPDNWFSLELFSSFMPSKPLPDNIICLKWLCEPTL